MARERPGSNGTRTRRASSFECLVLADFGRPGLAHARRLAHAPLRRAVEHDLGACDILRGGPTSLRCAATTGIYTTKNGTCLGQARPKRLALVSVIDKPGANHKPPHARGLHCGRQPSSSSSPLATAGARAPPRHAAGRIVARRPSRRWACRGQGKGEDGVVRLGALRAARLAAADNGPLCMDGGGVSGAGAVSRIPLHSDTVSSRLFQRMYEALYTLLCTCRLVEPDMCPRYRSRQAGSAAAR